MAAKKKNMRRSLFEAELSNRSPPEILPELFHVYEVVHARKVPEYGTIIFFTLPKKIANDPNDRFQTDCNIRTLGMV